MKKVVLLIISLLSIIYMSASAMNLSPSRLELEVQSLRVSSDQYIASYLKSDKPEDEFGNDTTKDKTIYEYDYRSPKKAFLYSLIIPGWGQKYAGSTIIKPILFLGTEAASWAFYFKYHGDGNKKTTEFQNYANQHWKEGDSSIAHSYRGWLVSQDTTHHLPSDTVFTEHLPGSKSQQYYEMIGKYDQFRGGWDDYWDDTPPKYDSEPSPHRSYYNGLRGKANDLLNKANSFLIVSLANHLLSAFDAMLAAQRHNRNQSGDNWVTINAEMKKYSATEETPILRFTFKF